MKTTHFWGPVANWGIAIAGLADYQRPPELVSGPMTFALAAYSAVFMRFAWMVKPRNMLLLYCHVVNEGVQLYHLTRKINYEWNKKPTDALVTSVASDSSPTTSTTTTESNVTEKSN